jgi:hypothetical protein
MHQQVSRFSFDIPTPRPEHVQRFAHLHRQHIGISLSEKQAAERLTALLIIVRYKEHEGKVNRLQRRPSTKL